jgi:probable phosphoglycerate mutase
MTQLILVRHGETLWNIERRMQGHRDSPLTDKGLLQARLAGRRLKDEAFSALYSSDLGRAHQTARCIADETGHSIIGDARLRERHFGAFEGLTAAEIAARYPEDYERFRLRDPDYAVPGGESAAAFSARCLACLEEIAQRHYGEPVVVVTHGLVLDALYRAATGLDHRAARPVPLLNASLNVFRYRGGAGWLLERWGDVDHLLCAPAVDFRRPA